MAFGPDRHRFDVRRFCAWLLGLVFLFSGVVKLMDPVGTGYIVQAYFHFFHLSFLDGIARLTGVLLSLLEGGLGVLLVSGVLRKITAIVTSSVLAVFFLLTLILLIANPTMDCGCFGEAAHLSHFQSFCKNIVLILLAVAAWAGNRHLGGTRRIKYVSAAIALLSLLLFCLLAQLGIPLKDYTDYAPGARLQAADIFATTTKNTFQTLFFFEKDGIRDTLDRPFAPGKGWKRAGWDNRIVSVEKPAPRLPVLSRDGAERDEAVTFGPVMVISFYDKPGKGKWEKARRFAEEAAEQGFTIEILCADAWYEGYPYSLSDRKILSTFNRSNGGVTYLYDGEIVAKWSFAFRPSPSRLAEIYASDYVEVGSECTASQSRRYQGFLLYLLAVLMLL